MINQCNTTSYAIALYDLADNNKEINTFLEQINLLDQINKDIPEFFKFMTSNVVNKSTCREIFLNIATQLKISKKIIYWIFVIIDNNKYFLFKELMNEFIKYVDYKQNNLQTIIYSAKKITAEQLQKIKGKLTKLLKQNVVITNQIDEELIGGLKIKVGTKIYDNTLKGQLNNLKHSIKKIKE